MKAYALPALLALLCTTALTRNAAAQQVPVAVTPPYRSINVNGEGIVRVPPDMAIIRFGVVTTDPNPAVARQRNAEAARDAMNAVRALGVPEANIQLETLRLEPRYEWDPQTQRQRDAGFEAVRDVVVRLEDLDKLPDLVAQVVEEGANRLNGIQYDLQNRDQVQQEALREALLDARTKAQFMAQTLGVSIGEVITVSERAFDYPRPVFYAREAVAMSKAADAAPVPEAYAAGEIEVRAVVDVAFGLR